MNTAATPRERWGTCCPFDPECDHSFFDEDELRRWLDAPVTSAEALAIVCQQALRIGALPESRKP